MTHSKSRLNPWKFLASAFLLVSLSNPQWAIAMGPNGNECTDDIELIAGGGCFEPCCTQDPGAPGHFRFLHTEVGSLKVRSNTSVFETISFPNLRSVEDDVSILFNGESAITEVSFPSLVTAGRVEVLGNAGLLEVGFPRLSSVRNQERDAVFKVQQNPSLASFSVPMLETIAAPEAGHALVQVRFNDTLQTIDFPRLRTLEAGDDDSEAYIFFQGNDSVQSVAMDDLRRLSAGSRSISYVVIDEMPSLTHLAFPQLTELLPTGGEYDFSELTVGHSPLLQEVSFPSLERVTLLQLSGLKGTERAVFPRLAEIQNLWIFRSCRDTESTLKMYICAEQAIEDFVFNSDDGLCGPTGYQLHSANSLNEAECDASGVCQSFAPGVTECRCDAVGLCLP